ncbi:hypothetical protein [Streptomyces sp. NPDC093261]|uniref:hypothetical protein n=1 Tax=Streptomyces sp. NPDC093261 TaxID=3366037 RepID=UPI003805280C
MREVGIGQEGRPAPLVLVCDVIRGRGTPHDIPWTVFGPWEKPGEKPSVVCGFSSFTRSWKVGTKA